MEKFHAGWSEAPASGPSPLRLEKVRSYHSSQPAKNVAGRWTCLAVPGFTTHWGVLVGNHCYHLTFDGQPPQKQHRTDLDAITASGHPICLSVYIVKDKNVVERYEELGQTKYSNSQVADIATALINAFGDYHRLFWNCQVFAEILLEILTDGKKFPRYRYPTFSLSSSWTSVDAAQVFLCAFVISLPTATTVRARFVERKRKALAELKDLITELEGLCSNPSRRMIREFVFLILVSEVDAEDISERVISGVQDVVALDANCELGMQIIEDDTREQEPSLWMRFKELIVKLVQM